MNTLNSAQEAPANSHGPAIVAFCPACKAVIAVGDRKFFTDQELIGYERMGLTVEALDSSETTTGKCDCVVTRTRKPFASGPITEEELLTITESFLDTIGERLNASWTESEEAALAVAIGNWIMQYGGGNVPRGGAQ